MNMAQGTELWIHCVGHFLSVLHCRVCVCVDRHISACWERGGKK